MRKLKASDKADALRGVPLFAGCSQAELKQITALTTDLAVTEGQVLCKEGDSGREFFVLVEGSAEGRSGRGKKASISAGDFFGELSLLDDGPRTMTVTMTSDGHVLIMTGAEFRALLRVAPSIALRVLATLAGRLRKAEGA